MKIIKEGQKSFGDQMSGETELSDNGVPYLCEWSASVNWVCTSEETRTNPAEWDVELLDYEQYVWRSTEEQSIDSEEKEYGEIESLIINEIINPGWDRR